MNITMEISFLSKVYSKSLLKGSPCLLLIISRKLSPFLRQILVYSCASLYDDYKLRQMQGISMTMTIDEYLESRIIRITKVVQ